MTSAKKASLAESLTSELDLYRKNVRTLPGIDNPRHLEVFVKQLVDSIRRISFVFQLAQGAINDSRRDPNSDLFDPLKAAVLYNRDGNINEASWLTFLAIHCGKSGRSGWLLPKEIYGRAGEPGVWTWDQVSVDAGAFCDWASRYFDYISKNGGGRYFGNHRKYETLDPQSNVSLCTVVCSYLDWVNQHGSHDRIFKDAEDSTDGSPRQMFQHLYQNFKVRRFGRTAKFDFLTMLAKLNIVALEPGSAYLSGATGPLSGAKLLFQGNRLDLLSHKVLDDHIASLEQSLSTGPLGMQVMEDALCNWQKSPANYIHFKG